MKIKNKKEDNSLNNYLIRYYENLQIKEVCVTGINRIHARDKFFGSMPTNTVIVQINEIRKDDEM